jgi:uncharacterized coiled-coil DUF342 family protein
MEKEEQIICMLEQIMGTLGEHGKKLDEHTRMLGEHGKKLDEHTSILGEHEKKLEEHSAQFKENKEILRALMTGQEYLKAEMDGMKIANAKEFGDVKEKIDVVSTNLDLLREDTWANKVDIRRIKNTMGME